MAKVSLEVALKELERWYDCKKVRTSSRVTKMIDEKTGLLGLREDLEGRESELPILVESIMDGVLIIEKDCKIKHKLKFEIGSELAIKELIYAPRVHTSIIQQKLRGVKATDGDGRLTGYIAALANQNTSVIKMLDTEDKKIGEAISLYFL